MSLNIGFISQKGGVGKSTLGRLIAREYAANEFDVLIADLDISQSTNYSWNGRRLQNNVKPDIAVQQFRSVEAALKLESTYDVIVFDGAPHATRQTLDIARISELVVIPTGTSIDDLEPTIKLAHELKGKGIERKKISIALSRIGNSQIEINEAIEYIKLSGYFLLDGFIPEKTSYRRASDEGKAATETQHQSTNEKADEVAQAIINRIEELNK